MNHLLRKLKVHLSHSWNISKIKKNTYQATVWLYEWLILFFPLSSYLNISEENITICLKMSRLRLDFEWKPNTHLKASVVPFWIDIFIHLNLRVFTYIYLHLLECIHLFAFTCIHLNEITCMSVSLLAFTVQLL